MQRTISLLGKKGHGKDYVSDLLLSILEKQAITFAFADQLKYIVSKMFNIDIYDLYNDSKEYKMINLTTFEIRTTDETMLSNIFIANKEKDFFKSKDIWVKFRDLLQYFGTDVMQPAFGPHIWINRVIQALCPNRVNIITDVRFISEYKAVKSIDSVTIRIINPNIENNDSHVSENQLDNYPADYTIVNNWPHNSDEDLIKQLLHILTELNEKEQWGMKL